MTRRTFGRCATVATRASRRSRFAASIDQLNVDRSSATGMVELPCESGIAFDHLRQRSGTGPRSFMRLPSNFERNRTKEFPTLSGSLRSKRGQRHCAGKTWRVHQRQHSAHAGGCAGVGAAVFLKIVYHGPKAMEELAQHVKSRGRNTRRQRRATYDAFRLIRRAKYGARGVFGRKDQQCRATCFC